MDKNNTAPSFFHPDDVHSDDVDSAQTSFFHPDDVSQEDRDNLASSLGMHESNVSQGESLLKGIQQGTTLGLSDELAGLAGAAGTLSGSSKTPSKEDLLNAYRQAQQEELDRVKLSKKQNPSTTFMGELAGGALLPLPGGALGSTVEKDAFTKALGASTKFAEDITPSMGEKIAKGALTGAGMGAIAGPGTSEHNYIAEPGQIGPDILKGAETGATIGAAAPVALKPLEVIGKGIVGAGKEAADFMLESPMAEYIKTAYKAGEQGRKIATKEGQAEVGKNARILNQGFVDELHNIKNRLSKGYEKILKGYDENGIKFDTSIDDAIQKVQDIKNTERIGDTTYDEAIKLEKLLANFKSGRERIVGYRPKNVPIVQTSDKNLEQLLQQKAKLNLSNDSQEKIAGEALKRRAAEINTQRGADLDEALSTLGEPDAEMPQSGFMMPETANDPNTGKNVVQMIDESTGKPIVKAINDFSPSNITIKKDPSTGLEFYHLLDEGTGKTYLKPVSKTTEPLSTEIDPIIGRPNISPQMSAEQMKELATDLRNAIEKGEISQYKTRNAANKFANALKKPLHKNPEYKQLDQNYETLKSVAERLKINPEKQSDEVMVDTLTNMFSELGKATKSADKASAIMNETLGKLEPVRPGITKLFKPRFEKMASEMDAREAAENRPFSFGLAVRAGGAAGNLTKDLRTFVNSDPAYLKTLGGQFLSVTDPVARKLGSQLLKMATQDNKGRQATMFTIMQDPKARQKLGIDIKEDNNESR